MELVMVGQRFGLGASRQRTYSILSLCSHLDARTEVSLHMFSVWGSKGEFFWYLLVFVIGLVKDSDTCGGAAMRVLLAGEGP